MRTDETRGLGPSATVAVVTALLAALSGACARDVRPASPAPEDVAVAERLYAAEACDACHGSLREGSELAPPLDGLATWWTEDRIVRYLEDPQAFARSEPSFERERPQFDTDMPDFGYLSADQRRALARWLLAD